MVEGHGLLAWRVKGRRVAVLNSKGGNWAEQVVIPARQAIPVPADLPDEQAAAFFVNPASALVMTQYVLRVPRGAWLLQTAAGSALGRMVIRLGKVYGFRTINVVRRREQVQELLQAGADAVVCTADESLADRVRELTGGEGVRFALDAVGGATGTQVIQALGRGGRLLLYGTLAGEPKRRHTSSPASWPRPRRASSKSRATGTSPTRPPSRPSCRTPTSPRWSRSTRPKRTNTATRPAKFAAWSRRRATAARTWTGLARRTSNGKT